MRPCTSLLSRAGTVVLSALLLVGTAMVAPAAAAPVACGTVITHSTTLTGDVGPCTGNGIIIGADGITLDLGGHRVFGTSSQGEGAGILLEGRSGVRVQNGTVHSFDAGVAILGGGANTVERIVALDNIGSGLTDFGDGIVISSSQNNQILESVAEHNGPFSGIAVFGGSSRGNTIHGNTVRGNNVVDVADEHHGDPTGTQQDDGIRLEPFTSNTTVTNNVVEGSGLDGIAIFARSTDNVLRGNTVRGNGFHDKLHRLGSGIIAFNLSARNVIENNIVVGNAANGIVLRGPVGSIAGSTDNQILRNQTRGNGVAFPGEGPFYDLRDDNFTPPCDNNTWRGNTFVTFNQPCVTG